MAKVTMSGENIKEIFGLFINKLVFPESVLKILWLAISSLDTSLDRNASLRIIIKVLFWILII